VPLKAAQLVERDPVGIVEVEARPVDAEQASPVLALEDEEAESRNLLGMPEYPARVDGVRSEEGAPAAGKGVQGLAMPPVVA